MQFNHREFSHRKRKRTKKMENIFGSNHFNNIGVWLRRHFGCKVGKLSFDGGFTCPNRDGSKGTGGCFFCAGDGAGHYSSRLSDPEEQIRLLSEKWTLGSYLAYFQNYTGTYAPVEKLRALYETALSYPNVAGLAIATRPDCLEKDVMELLSELNKRTFLWVELGLQTMHDRTAEAMNRCYPTSVFEEAMEKLNSAGIRSVVHLIFGLPGETRQDMLNSVEYLGKQNPFGVKFHQLYVMKGAPIASVSPDQLSFMTKKEYIDLIVDALEILPQPITVHRLTGDAPKGELIAPLWTPDKRSVLNGIQQEFKRRGSYQGIYSE